MEALKFDLQWYWGNFNKNCYQQSRMCDFFLWKAKWKFPLVVVKAKDLSLFWKGYENSKGGPFAEDLSYYKNHNGGNFKLVPMQLFHWNLWVLSFSSSSNLISLFQRNLLWFLSFGSFFYFQFHVLFTKFVVHILFIDFGYPSFPN